MYFCCINVWIICCVNIVVGCGMLIRFVSVYSLWVVGFLFLCVEKNNMLILFLG